MKDSFWTFFIKKRTIAWVTLASIIVLGLFAAKSLPLELQPEINLPYIAINTILPGASPSDVESLITKKIEDQIDSVDGIKKISSSSGMGISSILIELETETDTDKAKQDLKDEIDKIKNSLPEDSTTPIVNTIEANNLPIITFSISGNRPKAELLDIVDDLKDKMEDVNGVSKVEIIGKQEKEIEIMLDVEKMNTLNISINDVKNSLKVTNLNLPVGTINTGKLNYSVRIDNRWQSINDIQNTYIKPNVKLKNIATIKEKLKQKSTKSKLSINGEKSKEAITLQIFKKNNSNILEIADDTKNLAENYTKNQEFKDITISISNDNSEFIRTDLGILINSGIQTTLLIIFILFLALGAREGILAGLSIPLTLLSTLTVIDMVGLTINSLTLFSLVIALGLVVDTSIVIMEGIDENIKKGLTPTESAIQSVETYKWPLIAGSLTTVFAFFPMLTVSGIIGEFLKSLPITISAALLSSIFISLTITPAISSKFVKTTEKKRKTILEPFFDKLGDKFEKLTNKILEKNSIKLITLLIATILLGLSLALPITGKLKVEMFPKTDMQYFIINVETPTELSLNETEKQVEKVEDILYKENNIKNFLTIIGTSQGVSQMELVNFDQGKNSNLANITVNLIEKDLRKEKSYEIAKDLRKKLEKIPGVKIKVQEISEGPPSSAPVGITLKGDDIQQLKKTAQHIEEELTTIKGTENISNNLDNGPKEFKFILNQKELAKHQLSVGQVSSTIRSIVQGININTITINGDEKDLTLRYNTPRQNNIPKISISYINNIKIKSPKGYNVKLGDLGKYEIKKSLASIKRIDKKKTAQVFSDLKLGYDSTSVTEELKDKLKTYKIPKGIEISYGGEREDIDESFNDLFHSMIYGVILIAFTLIIMFNSLKQPIIIMLSLPLALIGVFPGLYLIGLNLSFPAFLGVVALSGIVVNDSIVLIDRINQNRRIKKLELKHAISEATKARLQPIIMTSITTIIGIIPLALTNQFWAGLGFSLIFGLTMSTSLVLIITPIIYYFLEIRGEKKLAKSN